MKNYLTEWKKWKSTIKENVEAAQAALDLAKQKQEKIKGYVETLIDGAQGEIAAAQADVEKAKAEEAAARAQAQAAKSTRPPSTGTTGTTVTSEAKGIGFGGAQQEGTPGVPVSVYDEELTEEEQEEASGCHEGIDEAGRSCQLELQYEEMEEEKTCNECRDCLMCGLLTEAKYKGRNVTLNKPMRGDVKKFKVFVRDPSTGNIKKVNFGDKKMRIKKSNPKRRKSFRARHNCANPGPKTMARYWACRSW
jgi:hypothetical protein